MTLRDEDGEPVVKVTSQHSGAWPNRPPRCGSFPLMNLAEDFGVAYGDVLLLSDYYRRSVQGDHVPGNEVMAAAHSRCSAIICAPNDQACLDRMIAFIGAIHGHAERRWAAR